MTEVILGPASAVATGWQFVIDPTTEDAANVQLDINNGDTYRMREPVLIPEPEKDSSYVRVDEGEGLVEHHYQNRTIGLSLWVMGSSPDNLVALLGNLSRKVAKLDREGGTLKITTGAADVVIFDLLAARMPTIYDTLFNVRTRAEMTLEFTAKPFGRGEPTQLADHTETTLPALIFTEQDIPGDVPALGKLVVDEDDGDDQWFLNWGIESRHYDTTDPANKKLFFQAEALTALSTTAAAVGAAGTSGTGSNVMRNTDLTTSYQAVLSTQLTGGGAHLGHVGTYRVWARLYRPTGNTGAVDVALEWAEGDFRRFTQNTAVNYEANEREGVFTLADLGLVNLTKVAQGTQRWEGRVVAKSTEAGDELDVDCLFLFPIDEGYGEVRANPRISVPTAFSARDEFNQSVTGGSDPLGTTALPVGGSWAGAGDADDFVIEDTGHTLQRSVGTVDSAATNGRFAIAGATNYITVAVQADVKKTGSYAVAGTAGVDDTWAGVLARYTDTSNWLMAVLYNPPVGSTNLPAELRVYKRVAGTETLIGSAPVVSAGREVHGSWYSIRLTVDANGRFNAYFGEELGAPIVSGSDADLATGGALATGKPGLYHVVLEDPTFHTANFDDFAVWIPTFDAAVFASQSLELRNDRVIREDSAGAVWSRVSDYEGRFLLVPPAGPEDRQTRIIVMASRNLPEGGADSGIDDISARLTYTPRWLQIPG